MLQANTDFLLGCYLGPSDSYHERYAQKLRKYPLEVLAVKLELPHSNPALHTKPLLQYPKGPRTQLSGY